MTMATGSAIRAASPNSPMPSRTSSLKLRSRTALDDEPGRIATDYTPSSAHSLRWVRCSREENSFAAHRGVKRTPGHHFVRKGQDLSIEAPANHNIDPKLDPPDA